MDYRELLPYLTIERRKDLFCETPGVDIGMSISTRRTKFGELLVLYEIHRPGEYQLPLLEHSSAWIMTIISSQTLGAVTVDLEEFIGGELRLCLNCDVGIVPPRLRPDRIVHYGITHFSHLHIRANKILVLEDHKFYNSDRYRISSHLRSMAPSAISVHRDNVNFITQNESIPVNFKPKYRDVIFVDQNMTIKEPCDYVLVEKGYNINVRSRISLLTITGLSIISSDNGSVVDDIRIENQIPNPIAYIKDYIRVEYKRIWFNFPPDEIDEERDNWFRIGTVGDENRLFLDGRYFNEYAHAAHILWNGSRYYDPLFAIEKDP